MVQGGDHRDLDAPAPRVLTGDLAYVNDVLFESMERLNPDVLPHILRGAAASDLPPKQALSELRMPALILAWEGDSGHPMSTANELARLLRYADRHVAATPDDVRRWPSLVADFLR